jgi:hypothetical protein
MLARWVASLSTLLCVLLTFTVASAECVGVMAAVLGTRSSR